LVAVVFESSRVSVPNWVVDLESFRRWADGEDFPEQGRVWFLNGEVWVDMSKEQLFAHGAVKTEINGVLSQLVKGQRLGRYWSDDAFLTGVSADFAGRPDGTFVCHKALRSERVVPVEAWKRAFSNCRVRPTCSWRWSAAVRFRKIRWCSAMRTERLASANSGW